MKQNLTLQRRLAAQVFDVGENRIWLDPTFPEDLLKALTRQDIKHLIARGHIRAKPENSNSRGRIRHALAQKRKGRRHGQGSRKGKKAVRQQLKTQWVSKIRLQRELFGELKEKKLISIPTYRHLRQKSKGGFFRSPRHVKLYLTEKALWNKQQ